jgi:hypothetical protein
MTPSPDPATTPPGLPPAAGTGQQHIHVTGGDNSPVNVTAPFSFAARGGTAHASVSPSTPAPPTPWWSRAAVVWTAVGSLGTVAAVIVAIFALK